MDVEDTAQQWGVGPGDVLSERYRLGERLGEGGMGAVFAGEHLMMKKRVAVKLLHPEMTADKRMIARFHREAQSAATLDHPNICRVTDFGQTDGEVLFLIMEYLEGQTVRRLFETDGPLSTERALHITRQIAMALGEAHRHDIVHRDLKPENVMLIDRGGDPETVKLTDFGLAIVLVGDGDDNGDNSDESSERLTRAGEVFGTPHFMAPEQVAGDDVDGRTDLYALGVLLFEALTGTPPFEAEKVTRLMAKHLTSPIPKLDERAPSLRFPEGMQQLIEDLMAKDIDERPSSAQEVVERIDAIGNAESSTRREPAVVEDEGRQSRRDGGSSLTKWAAAAAVIVATFALVCTVPGVLFVYLNVDEPSETVESTAETPAAQDAPETAVDEAPEDEAQATEEGSKEDVGSEPQEAEEEDPDRATEAVEDTSPTEVESGRDDSSGRGRGGEEGPPGRTKGGDRGPPAERGR